MTGDDTRACVEGLLALCWHELVRVIYVEYTDDLPGSGAKVYAERTPYFREVERLRQRVAGAADAEAATLDARDDQQLRSHAS